MRMYFWLHLVGSHSVARVVFLDPKKIEMNWTPKQAEWPRCEGRKQTTDFQYVWMSFTIIFRIYSWKHIPSPKVGWRPAALLRCVGSRVVDGVTLLLPQTWKFRLWRAADETTAFNHFRPIAPDIANYEELVAIMKANITIFHSIAATEEQVSVFFPSQYANNGRRQEMIWAKRVASNVSQVTDVAGASGSGSHADNSLHGLQPQRPTAGHMPQGDSNIEWGDISWICVETWAFIINI